MRRTAWIAPVVAALAAPVLAAPVLAAPPATAFRLPTVHVVVADDAAEGDGVRVAVVLDHPSGHDVTVRVDTRAGTARAPGDYGAVHRRVRVPAGETRARFWVPTVADGLDEGPEDLEVRISRPVGAGLGRRTATATVRDRDPLPRVHVVPATFTEPALGHRLGYTDVRLSAPSGRRVVVELSTRDGTATAGQDFVRLYPTVVFAPGQTSRLVSVELLSDDRVEPPETMRLAITEVRHARTSPGGAITILDAPREAQLGVTG